MSKKNKRKRGRKRKHTNNYGHRQIRTGKCREQIRLLASRLGIPYGVLDEG